MAPRIVDWVITEDGKLDLNKFNSDKNAEVENQVTFDISEIFSEFSEMNKVQKYVTIYGVKQKLADSGSDEKTLQGRVDSAVGTWHLWLTGEISAPRANATGSSENKKAVSNAKAASEVVSLEGLIVKQLVYPEKFTEADAAKLQEFMELKFEESVRNMPENKNRK